MNKTYNVGIKNATWGGVNLYTVKIINIIKNINTEETIE